MAGEKLAIKELPLFEIEPPRRRRRVLVFGVDLEQSLRPQQPADIEPEQNRLSGVDIEPPPHQHNIRFFGFDLTPQQLEAQQQGFRLIEEDIERQRQQQHQDVEVSVDNTVNKESPITISSPSYSSSSDINIVNVVSLGGNKDIITPKLPDLAYKTIQKLGGNINTIVFLTNKKIEATDIQRNQNRLMIPKIALEKLLEAMTSDEKQSLGIVGDKIERTIKKKDEGEGSNGDNNSNSNSKIEALKEVKVVDGNGEIYDIHLTKWPSVGTLVLIKDWYKLVVKNKMEKDDTIGLWCFRDDNSNLCFAVVKDEEKEKARDQDNGASTSTKDEEEGKARDQDNGKGTNGSCVSDDTQLPLVMNTRS